ncbi:protein of unknown function [Candidatus Promineifilum breve]|uniref:Uncharacterized protein n=1 Tax=Candidatus Promineifilum breve TaxID=1806508 RepID=A0A160T829_9CHLR|nr:protein of unknown function [Candidatus Promineifilum breve]
MYNEIMVWNPVDLTEYFIFFGQRLDSQSLAYSRRGFKPAPATQNPAEAG